MVDYDFFCLFVFFFFCLFFFPPLLLFFLFISTPLCLVIGGDRGPCELFFSERKGRKKKKKFLFVLWTICMAQQVDGIRTGRSGLFFCLDELGFNSLCSSCGWYR